MNDVVMGGGEGPARAQLGTVAVHVGRWWRVVGAMGGVGPAARSKVAGGESE